MFSNISGMDFYDFAFSMFEESFFNLEIKYENLISEALYSLLLELEEKELIQFIGIDAYLDFKNMESSFYKGKFENFLEEERVLIGTSIEKYSTLNKERALKQGEILSNLYGLKDELDINPYSYRIFAEKLRKLHFPNSGLESVLIANGFEVNKY